MPKHLQVLDKQTRDTILQMPLPKSVLAIYMRPLRRQPTHGLPVCNLQLRSYSARNLEFFADFAMRAAYYLKLAARGPVPLPRITERWTVPRANFIFKKSQENFERRTLRRLIQIQDGHPDVVKAWLGYLEKRCYHGVGMKANVWEHEELGVGKRMDEVGERLDKELEGEWRNFGTRKSVAEDPKRMEKLLGDEKFARPIRDMERFVREPVEISREKS